MVLSKYDKEMARKIHVTEEEYKEYKRLSDLIHTNKFMEYESIREKLVPILKDALVIALGQLPVVLQKFQTINDNERAIIQTWAFHASQSFLSDMGVEDSKLTRKWGNIL